LDAQDIMNSASGRQELADFFGAMVTYKAHC